jgi:nucleotide-binding universal stress UspA family protein
LFDKKEIQMSANATVEIDRQDAEARGRTPRTLLVGFDGSDEARVAFDTAVERAGPDDTIVVVHAHNPVSTWMGKPYYDRAVHDNLILGQRLLDELRPRADQASAAVVFELHEGKPAEVISRIGGLRDVDEIIVGTRGLGRFRASLGSVAQELLRTADRPVLVLPHLARRDAV